MEIQYLIEKQECDRPNGTFIGGFYWQQPYGLADYEEEWGKKLLDGIDYDFAVSHPFYDRTGRTRPFGDKEELNRRRLSAANSKPDRTWNSVGYKISEMILEESLNSSENVSININGLGELLGSYDDLYYWA